MNKLIEEPCGTCKGNGYEIYEPFTLYRPCKICGGTGKTDWISNIKKVKSKDTDPSVAQKLLMSNINKLILQIKEECIETTGYNAIIEIKLENDRLDQINLVHGVDYGKTISALKTV